MKYASFAAAVLFAGCHAMQPTPVAPSATSPDAPSTGPRLPTFTAFDVRLQNGTTTAFADSPWLGFLAVTPHEGAFVTTPASVRVECGNGQATDLPAGTGLEIRFVCRWATSGEYVVRATVVAQHGVTTTAELPVHVQPPFTIPDLVSVDFTAEHTSSAAGSQTWTFTPTVTGRVVSLTWNFGDGTTITTGPNQVMNHRYTSNGIFIVTAVPRPEDGSTRAGARQEILIDGI